MDKRKGLMVAVALCVWLLAISVALVRGHVRNAPVAPTLQPTAIRFVMPTEQLYKLQDGSLKPVTLSRQEFASLMKNPTSEKWRDYRVMR